MYHRIRWGQLCCRPPMRIHFIASNICRLISVLGVPVFSLAHAIALRACISSPIISGRMNPVVLWAHDYSSFPIGRSFCSHHIPPELHRPVNPGTRHSPQQPTGVDRIPSRQSQAGSGSCRKAEGRFAVHRELGWWWHGPSWCLQRSWLPVWRAFRKPSLVAARRNSSARALGMHDLGCVGG